MKHQYWIIQIMEAYLETCQTPKIEFLSKTVKSFQLLTISIKSSILDVW